MTLQQAAEKQYLRFMKATLQIYQKPMPWDMLPMHVRFAWETVVKTCPRVARRQKGDLREYKSGDSTK